MFFSSYLSTFVYFIVATILFLYVIMDEEVILMHIIHLSHSGFLVEDDGDYFLFDPVSPFQGPKDYERLFVFVSHAHHDHFKPDCFNAFYKEERAHFIFSRDIEENISKPSIANLHILDNYESVDIEEVHIESYGTTDAGNSYFVSAHGVNYFHSGDLNWWHWKRMSDQELKVEEEDYKREVDRLRGKSIDYAFVPVDPRLEEYAYLAINYFIKTIKPKFVIPMHSFRELDFYKDLERHVNLMDTTLIPIDEENQEILSI